MKFYSKFFLSRYLKLRYVIALSLFVLVTAGFASLADEVRDGDTLPIDRAVLTSINSNLSNPVLDAFIPVATNLAGVLFLLVLTMLIVGILIVKKLYSKALFLGLVMTGAGIANLTLKLLFERQRPELWQRLVEEATFSFPSGHAMGSMAFGLAVIALCWSTKWRKPVAFTMSLYIIFIGFSRLYLGVHYPSDILAGWILSAGWVSLLVLLLRINKGIASDTLSQSGAEYDASPADTR